MDNFEKIVFLEMTNKQFSKFPEQEYFKTYNLLTQEEQIIFSKISAEIHQIWNYINTNQIVGLEKFNIETLEQYNEKVSPISDIILKVSLEFGITLEREISEKLKKSILCVFGKDYLDKFLGKI